MIRIGTSGYSFKDWVGPFYPPDTKPSGMLDYYTGHFKTVEINSTYYRIPHPKVFDSISKKLPVDFDVMIKVNHELTHKKKHDVSSMSDIFLAVDGLIRAGKLKGFLAQFPYSFKFSQANLEHVVNARRACRGFPLFAEFRHSGWLNDEVYKTLAESDIGYCNVDEPPLEGLVPPQTLVTSDIGYIRFHGRNQNTWWDPEQGDRYDYAYSEEELEEWLPLVKKVAESARSDTYLFFNNCHMGQAVKNAKMMRDMLKDQLNLEVV